MYCNPIGEWNYAVDAEICVRPSNWLRPVVSCLPAWFRFAQVNLSFIISNDLLSCNLLFYIQGFYAAWCNMLLNFQCLRRYRDTREAFPHLVNAGKYSTTFFVVIFSALNALVVSKYNTEGDNIIFRKMKSFWYLAVSKNILRHLLQ